MLGTPCSACWEQRTAIRRGFPNLILSISTVRVLQSTFLSEPAPLLPGGTACQIGRRNQPSYFAPAAARIDIGSSASKCSVWLRISQASRTISSLGREEEMSRRYGNCHHNSFRLDNCFTQKPRRMLIGGRWVEAESGRTLSVINPATEEEICTVPAGRRKTSMQRLRRRELPWKSIRPSHGFWRL